MRWAGSTLGHKVLCLEWLVQQLALYVLSDRGKDTMENGAAKVTQITPKELKARLDAGEPIFLLDVREPDEREICNIGGELIPKDTVGANLDRIPRDNEIVVYCRSGGRSDRVANELVLRHGYAKVSNLSGGMLRWADEVDSTIRKY